MTIRVTNQLANKVASTVTFTMKVFVYRNVEDIVVYCYLFLQILSCDVGRE